MSKEFKDTLLMPKTDFPMRGNLGKREVEFQQKWKEMDLYNEVLKKNEGKPLFVLHDGPPYANGDLHMGHALNKILKDMIVRQKNMSGFKAPFIPGWDTHGLPIESAIAKKGVKRKELSTNEFRLKCEEYARGQVEKQKEQFKRLGINADFDNPYLTLDKSFEAAQIKVFGKMVEKGLIFKGLKPVHWSPSSESALAEAEIEYQEKTSPSIYVAFKSVKTTDKVEEDVEFVIWTTTPWTMPANLAIAVGEEIEYTIIKANDRKFMLATSLVESVVEAIGFENYEVLSTVKGIDIEGCEYKHPIYDRVSPVVIGHHVTEDGGTGLVHIAPGHGEEDFIVGKKYGLDVLCPVNDRGVMTSEAGFVEGMFYETANKEIGMALENAGALLKLKFIKHSYPHDWRTKKPVMFRATAQWFASIELIKERMMDVIQDVEWLPLWGEKRIHNMIKDRESWCISRQRVWGVPIPVFYNEDGSEILDTDVINHVSKLFGEHGSNIWFEWEAKDLLPEGYTNKLSPNNNFTKEKDIMDVWFDSGTSHHGVCKERGLPTQSDLYLEGNDQYRGWFNSSLSTSVAATNEAPYKAVVTHGMVVDGKGHKMSKSLGNGVNPIKEANKMGADILRLWVASSDFTADIKISQDIIKQVSESYRKIRNTFRFILGNVSDYNNDTNRVEYKDLEEVDKYMHIKLENLTSSVLSSYNKYNFMEVYKKINTFITNDLSSFYLDFTKDILYIEKADSKLRRSTQTIYYSIIDTLTKLLAPILPHTTSEVYPYIPNKELKDIMLEDMPITISTMHIDVEKEAILSNWTKFLELRNKVLKSLEEARDDKIIGKSFSAKLIINPDQETYELINSLSANLRQIFIVSDLVINEVTDELSITVEAKEGHTCPRCWQIVDEINNDGLCERCANILK